MVQVATRAFGEGVPVLLVHGSLEVGEDTWEGQRPLADDGYRLVVVDRRGYGESADASAGEDFVQDGRDLAELLDEPAHLVGHSYGGISALFAAAERPEGVRSLTVIEPPAFSLRPDDPAVAARIDELDTLWAQSELSDREFLGRFLLAVGESPDEMPGELLDALAELVPPLRNGRPAWSMRPPLDRLASQDLPALVVSGGHDPAFDAVCDEVAEQLDARKETITGAGHEVQMQAGELNRVLADFWRAV